MTVDDIYPLWLEQGRSKLAKEVEEMQTCHDRLLHKESVYGRSVKAVLDLRVQMLALWDSAPNTLPEPDATP